MIERSLSLTLLLRAQRSCGPPTWWSSPPCDWKRVLGPPVTGTRLAVPPPASGTDIPPGVLLAQRGPHTNPLEASNRHTGNRDGRTVESRAADHSPLFVSDARGDTIRLTMNGEASLELCGRPEL